MEALTKLTGSSRSVRKGKIILMAALITTLFDGFGSQAGAQPQTAAARKVAEPITIELTKTGQLTNPIDANGAPLDPGATTKSKTNYRFSTEVMTNPTNASVQTEVNCISKEKENVGWCVPSDRSAWIREKSGNIQRVYYKSETGSSTFVRKRHLAPPPRSTPFAAAAACSRCVFGICLCP
jgi:hypothetical protein